MSNDVDQTLWVGNLPNQPEVSEDILFELFLQAGPVESVKIAKEHDGRQKSFAFVKFSHVESVPYTIKLMEGTQLYGRNLKLQTRPGSCHQQQRPEQQQQQQQTQPQVQPLLQQQQFVNPYQNMQPQNIQNPYMQSIQIPMNIAQNPYNMNQPVMNQSAGGTAPGFHRSHTWHGPDLSGGGSNDQDRDDDRRRDNHSRERSHDRNRDNYRGSPSNESFESRRQKVLHKQEQVLQHYRRDHNKHSRNAPYHQGRHRYNK